MTTMIRKAQLWAGLSLITMLLAGCPSPEPSECQQDPASCMDGGMMDGSMDADSGNHSCTPVAENCFDGIDNDCDHRVDANDTDCGGSCTPVAENAESCLTAVDNDCDNKVSSADNDCTMPMCHPGGDYGTDVIDGVHGTTSDYCFDFSWRDDLSNTGSGWSMADILADVTKTWSCCPTGGGACVLREFAYANPNAEGLEPGAQWNDQSYPLGSEVGPSDERLLVNRPHSAFTRVLDNGNLERGTISGNTRTVNENCQ